MMRLRLYKRSKRREIEVQVSVPEGQEQPDLRTQINLVTAPETRAQVTRAGEAMGIPGAGIRDQYYRYYDSENNVVTDRQDPKIQRIGLVYQLDNLM